MLWIIRNAIWLLAGTHALAFMVGRWSRRSSGPVGCHHLPPVATQAYLGGGREESRMGAFLRGALVLAAIIGVILLAQHYLDSGCDPVPFCG